MNLKINSSLSDLINDSKLTNTDISDIVNDSLENYATTNNLQSLQNKSDNSLSTINKDIAAAINEIYESLNNNKQLIMSTLGSSSSNNSFEEIKNKIEELISEKEQLKQQVESLPSDVDNFKSLLLSGGYNVESKETISDILNVLIANGLGDSNFKQIISASYYTFLLTSNGDLYVAGDGSYGQLGTGDEEERHTFELVASNVKYAAADYRFSLIVKNDGTVWSTGRNSDGQLGLNNTTTYYAFTKVTTNLKANATQVAIGAYHSVALTSDGSVYSCGRNESGQLGSGSISSTDVKVFTKRSITGVQKIACGQYYTVALKSDGTVWACGDNSHGSIGLGSITTTGTFTATNLSNIIDIACGEEHTVALKSDGTVWVCGSNDSGQLGLGDTTYRNTFVQVPNITNAKRIFCGDACTVIVLDNYESYYAGYSNEVGESSPVTSNKFIKTTYNVHTWGVSSDKVIILKNDNTLWGTGRNNYGQLGLGYINTTSGWVQIKI